MSRRSLLRAAAGAGLALPWLESLPGSARAQSTSFPTRLVLFFTSCGTLYDEWKPTGTETAFTLGPLLAPLAPHQSELVVVDGLDLRAAIDSPGDGHQPGIGGLWTGAPLLPGTQGGGGGQMAGWGSAPSVDQLIAQHLMPQTALPTLELGIKVDDGTNHSRMIYAGANAPVAPENNPQLAFDRLFGAFGGDAQALQRLNANRARVVDVVRAQVQRVQPHLARADRLRLDQHLASLASLQQSLSHPVTPLVCALPSSPVAPAGGGGAGPWYLLDQHYPTVAAQQMQLAVSALTCDLTRIVSLQFDHSQGDTVFSFLGHNEGHHDLSHSPASDGPRRQKLRDINLWYAQRFADLLALMKAVPEGSGTMLDHSLVVWGNELQAGDTHNHTRMPFVLAGRASGALQTGRFLSRSGPHNALLVSLCQKLGANGVNQVGPAVYGSGPLPGL